MYEQDDSASGASIERRQFPRIDVDTNINFAVVIPSYEAGTSRNISQVGLSMEMKRKLAVGTILRLEFDLPGDKPEHIEALGRIMWQRPSSEDNFLTGIKFLA